MKFRTLVLVAVLSAVPVHAQGSKLDYERSAGLRERFSALDPAVASPQWIDEHRLWLVRSQDGGPRELVVVDAQAPASGRVERLAALDELARMVGRDAVQVSALQPDGEGAWILLLGDAGLWRLTPDAPSAERLSPHDAPALHLPMYERPPRGRRGGGTGILFFNDTEEELELRWIQGRGQRRSYGRLKPGETRWMTTYAGHSWVLTDDADRDVAFFVGERHARVAVIDDGERAEPARRGGPRTARGEDEEEEGQELSYRARFRDDQVALTEAGSREPMWATTDGTPENTYRGPARFSPDGSAFVCMQVEVGETRTMHIVEAAPDDQLQPKLHSRSYTKPGDRIDHPRPRLFRVGPDGEVQAVPIADDLFPNPWRIDRLRWAPDGSHFTFLYNQRGHEVMRWIAVDARTGEARALIDEDCETFFDYSAKTYLRVLEETGEAIWMSERSGWNHLYRVDAATGEVLSAVTSGPWVVRAVQDLDEETRTMLLRVCGIFPDQDPYHEHWIRVSLDGGEPTHLTHGDGTHQLEFSSDGAFYLDTYSRVDMAPVLELRRSADGALVSELDRASAADLERAGWIPPQRFVAKGRDGETDIWGVVYRPTNWDPEGRYPLIESIYAGPHGHHVPKDFRVHRKTQEMTELGFIVVQIDGMGTNWRSKAFHDVAWKNLGDSGFPDRIAWIRALADTDPTIDLDRVGIYGGSAGGQSALRALLVHPDFYKVGVADCGCHDNRMDKIWWNELWMSWPVGPHYEEQSNVTQAHRLEGDLLLIVGEMDTNVDPASTMQVVDALIDADKDFDLLLMPGTGHGAAETRYGTRRRRDFFVRHLLGREPRWE